jgi:release factor glutamine methyltransferase
MSGEDLLTGEAGLERFITLGQSLQEGAGILSKAGIENAYLDAELLLCTALGWKRERLYVNHEMPLETRQKDLFWSFLLRRSRREPIAYITGHKEFWSLDFLVCPEVLIPRPETEHLVSAAIELLAEVGRSGHSVAPNSNLRILELGTGSGAVAITLAKEIGNVEIWATDLSLAALTIARGNAARQGVRERIHFVHGQLFEPIVRLHGFFYGIVSNPPYVRRSELQSLPPEVRNWEPKLALDGGWDALDFHRQIAQQGHLYLKNEGFIALEIGFDMGMQVCQLFGNAGCYREVSIRQDYSYKDRVVFTRKIPQLQKFN